MNAGEEFMENNYRKDFRYAREVISNSSSSIFMNNDYDMDRPYWATTQNLNYIKDLCKNNDVKTAFTILGSADPIFELIGVGASDIVATDVNRFAKYIFYLKKAAFKTLSENLSSFRNSTSFQKSANSIRLSNVSSFFRRA